MSLVGYNASRAQGSASATGGNQAPLGRRRSIADSHTGSPDVGSGDDILAAVDIGRPLANEVTADPPEDVPLPMRPSDSDASETSVRSDAPPNTQHDAAASVEPQASAAQAPAKPSTPFNPSAAAFNFTPTFNPRATDQGSGPSAGDQAQLNDTASVYQPQHPQDPFAQFATDDDTTSQSDDDEEYVTDEGEIFSLHGTSRGFAGGGNGGYYGHWEQQGEPEDGQPGDGDASTTKAAEGRGTKGGLSHPEAARGAHTSSLGDNGYDSLFGRQPTGPPGQHAVK